VYSLNKSVVKMHLTSVTVISSCLRGVDFDSH